MPDLESLRVYPIPIFTARSQCDKVKQRQKQNQNQKTQCLFIGIGLWITLDTIQTIWSQISYLC